MSAEHEVFSLENRGDCLVLTPRTELSEVLVDSLVNETPALMHRIETEGPHLVIDLTNTSICGTDFLGLLLKMWKRVRPREGRMALCNVSDRMAEVLGICDLDRIWPICLTVDEAIKKVHNPG